MAVRSIWLSATGVAEIAESTHLKRCPYTFVCMVYMCVAVVLCSCAYPSVPASAPEDSAAARLPAADPVSVLFLLLHHRPRHLPQQVPGAPVRHYRRLQQLTHR